LRLKAGGRVRRRVEPGLGLKLELGLGPRLDESGRRLGVEKGAQGKATLSSCVPIEEAWLGLS
jgi:hypothetical protein